VRCAQGWGSDASWSRGNGLQIPLLETGTRIYLTTGWRQPEAVALYLAMGYTPLYDPSLPAEDIGLRPFGKQLVDRGGS
jgi:hypothetical protein